MKRKHLAPWQVVLDLVLPHAKSLEQDPGALVAIGTSGQVPALIIRTSNHRGQKVTLACPVHFDGEPDDGQRDVGDPEPPRFVLRPLGPSVWKLAPSVLDQTLHAYITIVNVPLEVENEWLAQKG